ncbi:DUF2637 domain-containing protein [Streptomyces griseoaurantiacus]|uniref:DUF2637 domain-containing protein n=1 Tax=Streptomyces griseoaurantiacus TaxID=68213 RepID=A0A1G7N5D1_9ACTN|nr:DUF2637 domain-containing protein [Streptomyces jietaisiensis]SDF69172.1 Protein of unknown function [Streptomyces jietaisiensis]
MPSRTTPATPELAGTTAIRAGVALLAAIAFALSYDALRQMAVAIHIRGLLTYAFPLVIDGFIAIGVGALLMLRTAPLHSRIYVWALVGVATVTSIWANALHAVRLNQQTRHADSLRLDDVTVGILSAIAPLALAGAVHLYLVIQRHPTQPARQAEATPRHNHDATAREPRRPLDQTAAPANAASAHADVAKSAQPDAAPHAADAVDIPGELLSIARTAPPGRGGRASRRHIEDAIRAKDLTIGRKEADQIKTILQAELDEAAQQQAGPAQVPVTAR